MRVREWIEQTRNGLLSGKQEALDVLAGDVDIDQTLIRLEGEWPAVRPGTVMEAGLESMYVRRAVPQTLGALEYNSASTYAKGDRVVHEGRLWLNTGSGSTAPSDSSAAWVSAGEYAAGHGGLVCTVLRGYENSRPLTHEAGATVRFAPSFSAWRIWEAVRAEVAALSSPTRLYRVIETEFDVSLRAGDDLYSIPLPAGTGPDDVWKVLTLRYRDPYYDSWRQVRGHLEMVRGGTGEGVVLGEGESYSGLALRVKPNQYPWDYRIKMRAQLATALSVPGTDDLDSDAETFTGLPATALDLPVLGAMYRLMAPLPGRFVLPDAQDEPRRPGEVAGGSGQSAVTRLRQRYEERVSAESRSLRTRYGTARLR